jgi:thiamine-phosphate pyrophosphorylase
MKTDYRLIAIADDVTLGDRDVVEACQAAEAGGATCIQLRMKRASSSQFLRVAEEVVEAVGVPVFVNDRADVAILARAAGLHIGADDISFETVRAIESSSRVRIGVSVGRSDEAAAVKGLDPAYWGSGPVYRTRNKSDAGAAIGLDGLSRLVRLAGDIPVVAIGGIRAENCAEILTTGACGIAVIGEIFGSGDVEMNTKILREALDS